MKNSEDAGSLGDNQHTTGSRHQPLGSCSQLHGEDQPVVCCDCNSRGTVFQSPQMVQELSPYVGEAVTLNASICSQELRKFRFVWICNKEQLPSQDSSYCMFKALERSYCFCIAQSSNNSIYHSKLFIVEPKKTTSEMLQPTTDPTVPDPLTEAAEETESRTQADSTNTSPTSQMYTTNIATPSTAAARGSFDGMRSSDPQAHQPVVVQLACLQPNPSQSVHDSEPEPMPSAAMSPVQSFNCDPNAPDPNAELVVGSTWDSSLGSSHHEMASLSPWERTQLEDIHLLLKRARTAIQNLKEKENALRSDKVERVDASQDGLTFRDITLDLYSVLDYTFFLLYCHFANKGQPDFSSQNARDAKFPSKPSGVKTSQADAQDKKETFMEEKLKVLQLGENTSFRRKIGEVIFAVQPKLKVDSSGTVIGNSGPKISRGDEESFALLHFYRNCSAHRCLFRFHPESDNTFWVRLPEAIARREGNGHESRELLKVLHQLISFVRKTASELLRSSVLPSDFSFESTL